MMKDKERQIKVLVVEDSLLMCGILTNVLEEDPAIKVVGVAHNGQKALDMVAELNPDIITMDIHMPVMDGLEATKQIMASHPTPILIVSNSVFKIEMENVFKAISYGALDVIDKGSLEINDNQVVGDDFIEKIKTLSRVNVIRHPLAKFEDKGAGILGISQKKALKEKKAQKRLVAIVASTGGPKALEEILKHFPKKFPCGIVIVQHIASGFSEGLVEWLNQACPMTVKIPSDGEPVQPGVVYIAPCDVHMKVEKIRGGECIKIFDGPSVDGQKPSGSILTESAAEVYQEGAIGVILTGMGQDGAAGIKAIKHRNGYTIAQDKQSCAVFGMPKVAIEMDVIDSVLPLKDIAVEIIKILETPQND